MKNTIISCGEAQSKSLLTEPERVLGLPDVGMLPAEGL